jgi:hypothetical protein
VGESGKEKNMTKLLLFVGTILASAAYVPYIRDIMKHGVRPRLVSWVIWTLLLGLMTVVSVQERAWGSALATGVSTMGCLAVVVLGWNYATRGVTRFEAATFVAALAGIALWLTLDTPLVVMLVAIAIDAAAYLPTLVHGWQDPEEESWLAYAVGVVGEGAILAAILQQHGSFIAYAYPLYAVVFGMVMVGIIALAFYRDNTEKDTFAREW